MALAILCSPWDAPAHDTMQFSKDDIKAFADWSGDQNPLHVDPDAARRTAFGQPVVHGILTAIRALAASTPVVPPRQLDVEFRGAVFPGITYDLDVVRSHAGLVVTLRSEDGVAVTLRAGDEPRFDPTPAMPWAANVAAAGRLTSVTRPSPATFDVDTLLTSPEVSGVFRTPSPAPRYTSGGLTMLQGRVLGLCSYLIGMELPGLRSLFTSLTVAFAPAVDDSEVLLYRARTVRFDRNFRMLDIHLEVATAAGDPIAVAELRSYVRLTPIQTDPRALAAAIGELPSLQGQVALVCGGTRGLGAEITAALAMAGCHVFASYSRNREAARELTETVAAAGGAMELVEGDAKDPAWCDDALATIMARHGRLDHLVLNACAPPAVIQMRRESVRAFNSYVADNLPLVQVPLATCLPAIDASGGTIICISSSFVSEAPAGFGHYVALKEAVEATVRTASRDGARALIVRPPRLQTAWNDTPTGVLGTIPASDAAVHIVRRLADRTRTAPVDLLIDFPAVDRPTAPARRSPPELLLNVIATFTADSLLEGFRFWFKALDINAEVAFAPYGQMLQTLLDPANNRSDGRGMHVIMLRVRDWLRELSSDQLASPPFLRSYMDATGSDFIRAVRTHRAHASAESLLVLCPSAPETPGPEEPLLDDAEAEIVASLTGIPGLTVVRARDWHATYDVSDTAIGDPFRDHLAHVPYQTAYVHTLATLVVRHLHRTLAPPRKVIVVDCDHTLWHGVVGEVGADGVVFDDGHRALHAALVRLNESGVLIALCSKNEEADVWRVFETRTDFLLRRAHIVTAAINWLPKSANLRTLAGRLNLGLESFVFVDDNPIECAEVRAGCPEVLTIQWPQEPEKAIRLLRHVWELDIRPSTSEDLKRTQLYKDEFRRQALQAETLTFRDFLASLELAVDFAPLAPADVKRAAQLTLRTNQFNFTTKRRDEADVQALVAAGTHEMRTVRVRDRFGDYGLVGLLIGEPAGTELFADTFLLSCRVLGRGVEHQMVAELGRIAAARALSTVRLRVEPSNRNAPARAFLKAIAAPDGPSGNDGELDMTMPVSRASTIRFDPPEQVSAPVEADDRGTRVAAPSDPSLLRSRESLITRTALDLSTPEGLALEIDGTTPTCDTPQRVRPLDGDFVFDTFARALGIPAEKVRELDNLEALGCDSFKIVEITVSLVERFPWLPPTLLFEHRSVSQIAKQIRELPGPERMAQETPQPRGTVKGSSPHAGDIAVVGMHLRCAGAESPDELWNLLRDGRVAVGPVSSDRTYFLRPLEDGRPHFAGLLDDVGRFETELFGITPREAQLMDPQLRLFLEVAWNALQDAGCLGGGLDADTGVFTGVMYADYAHYANMVAKEAENPFKCWEGFSLANRISQVFGFRGPSLAIDTACSSSATAIHLACRALNAGDCRVAIAGGVNLILDPDRFVQLGRLGILSTSGRCVPFGADADGTVLGEGAGVVVLRPVADAIERGDRIYGVIKASGVSTGSGTVGFTAPNPQAQALAARRAVVSAGVDPRTISYVETHGTGTALGDPIEIRGLALAYGDVELWDANLRGEQACTIGSIKPNIGHLEAGAGVLGLIKVLLQMQRATLLPSVTSQASNPQIAFGQTRFTVQRTLAPWTRPSMNRSGARVDVPRRAALNSFGVGGANVHLVLEEPPELDAPVSSCERPLHVLTLSAGSVQRVQERAADLARVADNDPSISVADLCFSANTAQRPLAHRAAILAHSREDLIDSLRRVAAGETYETIALGSVPRSASGPTIAYLFTGQGSQYPGMGRELYDTQPAFKMALDRCAQLFQPLLESNLLACMFAEKGSPESERLDQTAFTQPALFSLGYALSELWRSWGVTPSIVFGHSIGELTAMCVGGGLALEDAVTVVAARGRLMQALPPGGAMTSVMTSEATVLRALAGYENRVSIAAINGPEQVVISGDAASLEEISAHLREEHVRTKPLAVSHAFHSPAMGPMLAEFGAILTRIRFRPPTVTFVSSVSGEVAGTELLHPEYWIRNVSDPVRFADGMRCIDALNVGAYLEIGPQPILLGLARQGKQAGDASPLSLPSIRNDGQSWPALLSSLARLFLAGGEIDWRRFDSGYARRRVSLPPYRFAGRHYWIPTGRGVRAVAASEPAERQTAAGALTYEIAWRRQPWHQIDRTSGTAGIWVILGNRHGAGGALARALEGHGGHCVVASPGDGNHVDLTHLLGESARDLRGVVFIPAVDQPGTNAPGDVPRRCALAVEQAVDAIKAVVQMPASGSRLWIVTRNAVAVSHDPESAVDPAHSALWGAGRTFALEHPDRWGGLLDVTSLADGSMPWEQLANELLNPDVEDQVALRHDGRHVPRLIKMDASAVGAPRISATGTYLVTGGLGALGRHVARWLVSRGARRLVLTGRRGLETEGAGETVRELEAAGAAVSVVAADISTSDGVASALSAASPEAPIAGVFHAAGVDYMAAIHEVEVNGIREVLAAKAAGAWLLHEQTMNRPLDFFVCFSSIAGVLGSPGRSAYAASNAFVDGLARERQRLGLPALSVNWGPWSGGGMASTEALEQYSRAGNFGIVPAEAVRALERLLDAGATQATVADIDWPVFKSFYQARRPRPILSEIDLPPGEPTSRRTVATKEGSDWITHLMACEIGARLEELTALLRTEMALTLGLDGAWHVPVDESFSELGVDSLVAADFAQRLQQRLGIRSTAFVFEFPTVHLLASHLLEKLAPGAPAVPDRAGIPAPVLAAATPAAAALASASAVGIASSPDDWDILTTQFTSEDAQTGVTKAGTGRTEGYRPGVDAEVLQFQKRAWPNRHPGLIARRWQWAFVESADRLSVPPRVWLHRRADTIVGHNGAIPVRLKVGDEERPTAWLVDTMVLPEYRSLAIGARLMLEAQEDLPFALSLGQTQQMRAIQLRLGWHQVAPLETALLMIRPYHVLKGKLPYPAARAAGLALSARSTILDALSRRAPATVREIQRFGPSHDALWGAMARDVTCAVRRDASYLNWKYVDQPGQKFLRLEVTAQSGAAGVIVLMLREADEAYAYRRAFIVDIVAPLSNDELLADLLQAAMVVAEASADALVCLHVGKRLTVALQRAGYRLRQPSRYLLVRPGDVDDRARQRLLDPSGWFVTHGDSDIDRP